MKTYERIKEISLKTGLKQYIVAERCGYTAKTFSTIVNGRKPITDEDVIKICIGLETTPNILLGYETPKESETALQAAN